MSIDTHEQHDAPHGPSGQGGHDGHHEPPEVVDGRQRLGVWLFIGGDIIIVAALLFTYLYLRGVNTSGHWMSLLGYKGHSYAYYQNLENSSAGIPAPKLIHVGPMSAGLEWVIALITVVSAAVVWQAERALRATKNAKAFSTMAVFATIIAIVAIVLTIVQLRSIPEVFVSTNDSQGMAYTAYDSAFLAIAGSGLVHLVILTFLGLGLTIRSSKGLINGERWFQARLVRFFWVWVAASSVIVAAVTTTINTIH
jgi:heme/copper-type cytochrome/quinol oxidase subunit 3